MVPNLIVHLMSLGRGARPLLSTHKVGGNKSRKRRLDGQANIDWTIWGNLPAALCLVNKVGIKEEGGENIIGGDALAGRPIRA